MKLYNNTILAIDDNADNLVSLKAIIHDVIPATLVLTALSGPEGIELARSTNPDIIFLDIVMPGMDGFDVCRIIKSDEGLLHIPVVFLTALKTDKEARVAALETGADGFLSKPIDETELLAQIRAMLKIRSYHQLQQDENEKLRHLVAAKTWVLEKELAEHRMTEARLRETESRFRTMVEHSPIAYQALDEQGRYLDVNDEMCSLLGYDRTELIGRFCSDFWAPDDQPFFSERFAAILRYNSIHSDLRLMHRSGEFIDVQIEGRVQRDSNGEFIRTHCAVFNISQRKQMERTLLESEAMYRSLFHEHSAIKFLIDPDTGNIVDTNEAASRFYGWSRDELRQMTIQQINLLSEPEVCLELQNIAHQGASYLENQHRRADGSIRDVVVLTGCVEINGKVLVHSIIQDVTAQHELHRELVEAKERAVESDRLKSTFLANMSHEVRTPMNAIIGFSELLTDVDLPKEDQLQYTEIVKQRSYDLLGIIDDILNISLIDAGEVIIIKEEANVAELLTDLHVTFTQIWSDKKTQNVCLECRNELPASDVNLLMDVGRVRQVLTNLLTNAFKFTNEGCVTFGCRRENESEVLFYVEDTGIGITEDAMKFIFNRFRQVEESSARLYGGTGLGLSISKELVELMGGRIWVESRPDAGSTFSFTLPFVPALCLVS